MQLENQQRELLAKFVEAHLSTSSNNRGPFICTWPHNDKQATFFHSREGDRRFQGNLSDARILARLGLLDESPGAGNSTLFIVLPQAIELCQSYDKLRSDADTACASESERFDAFISYASEDRDSIALPIYKSLRAKGCSVWFDEAVLELGDSLREKIDEGLSRCRYGIVILSPFFFSKEWPRRELDGLVARETASGNKAILPVWHNISQGGVAAHSPTLADRHAAKSSDGVEAIAEKVVGVLNRRGHGLPKQPPQSQEAPETGTKPTESHILSSAKEASAISEEFADFVRRSHPELESPESAARQYMELSVAPATLEVTRKKQSSGSAAIAYDVIIDGQLVGKLHCGESVLFFVRPGNRTIWLIAHFPSYRSAGHPRAGPSEVIPARDESCDVVGKEFGPGERVRLNSRISLIGKWLFEEVH